MKTLTRTLSLCQRRRQNKLKPKDKHKHKDKANYRDKHQLLLFRHQDRNQHRQLRQLRPAMDPACNCRRDTPSGAPTAAWDPSRPAAPTISPRQTPPRSRRRNTFHPSAPRPAQSRELRVSAAGRRRRRDPNLAAQFTSGLASLVSASDEAPAAPLQQTSTMRPRAATTRRADSVRGREASRSRCPRPRSMMPTLPDTLAVCLSWPCRD